MPDPVPFAVAVIGGGPAGLAAAFMLARQGVAVGVFERSRYDSVRVGEVVPPEIGSRLRQLGVWERFQTLPWLPLTGITSRWGSAEAAEVDHIFHAAGHGWVLDRNRFDAMLAQCAAEAGARVFRGTCVVSCQPSPRGWRLECRNAARISHSTAAFVINATGRNAPLRGLDGRRLMADRLIAAVRYPPALSDPPQEGCRLCLETTADGWWYSAQLPDARYAVAHLTDADSFSGRAATRTKTWNQRWRETHLAAQPSFDLGAAARIHCFPAGMSRARMISGDGWLAIGDAAVALDPLSGRGILEAIQSGIDAAAALQAPLADRALQLDGYTRATEQRFDQALKISQAYYRAEQRWPSSPFWARRLARVSVLAS